MHHECRFFSPARNKCVKLLARNLFLESVWRQFRSTVFQHVDKKNLVCRLSQRLHPWTRHPPKEEHISSGRGSSWFVLRQSCCAASRLTSFMKKRPGNFAMLSVDAVCSRRDQRTTCAYVKAPSFKWMKTSRYSVTWPWGPSALATCQA